ncbi:MAG: acyl carrier protein [Methylophaga sp.]|nr:acyl carrier protein [Methylophaga sp.]
MTDNKSRIIRDATRDIVKGNLPENFDDVPLAQLGIDSLDFFELLIELEEKHGIDIPIEKLGNDTTISQLISITNE